MMVDALKIAQELLNIILTLIPLTEKKSREKLMQAAEAIAEAYERQRFG